MPRKAKVAASEGLFGNIAVAGENVRDVSTAATVAPEIANAITAAIMGPRGMLTNVFYASDEDTQYIADAARLRKVVSALFPNHSPRLRPARVDGHDGVTQRWYLGDKITRGPRLKGTAKNGAKASAK